jgi:hypothetical protein
VTVNGRLIAIARVIWWRIGLKTRSNIYTSNISSVRENSERR